MDNSTYSVKAIEKFRESFVDGIMPRELEFYVTAKTAKKAVSDFLAEIKDQDCPGVFVVGYGDMVKNTLTELISGGYEGCIVCTFNIDGSPMATSTRSLKSQKVEIFTVVPRLKGGQQLLGENHNVVFFFAWKTLLRVLELTAENTDSETFLKKWITKKGGRATRDRLTSFPY